jgi:N-acetyl sugar amidotransferase
MSRICQRCVMDDLNDPDIRFNELGYCNYCEDYFNKSKTIKISDAEKENELQKILLKIKNSNSDQPYNCIVGVSGGADSTYMVYRAKELGLRPLAVHYDNGWNSEQSTKNIESLLKKMEIPLFTYVNDWEEFKDLQLSFFKANVIDIELITDQAILAVLHKTAKKYKIKYILTGHNSATESILPRSWYHYKIDTLNIKAIHKKFGTKKLKSYPMVGFWEKWRTARYHSLESISLLNFMDYNKESAKKLLTDKIGWVDYGGKHFESVFTRFYQGYILPRKFNVDKRKAHYAALICSGQLTREEALADLNNLPYNEKLMEEDKEYVLKKLGFSNEEFTKYIKTPPVDHLAYPSWINRHYKILKMLGRNPSY